MTERGPQLRVNKDFKIKRPRRSGLVEGFASLSRGMTNIFDIYGIGRDRSTKSESSQKSDTEVIRSELKKQR